MTAQTRIYRLMADACVSLDMFTPIGEELVFTVQEKSLMEATSVLDRLGLPYDARTGLAKVTLVGAGMHGVPGVMARMAEFLSAAGVDVYQAADSHTTISVLVASDQTELAVRALHEGFELGHRPLR